MRQRRQNLDESRQPIIQQCASITVDREREVGGRPFASHDVHVQRGFVQRVNIIQTPRCPRKNMVNPQVPITDGLQYDRSLPVPVLRRTHPALGAPRPLAVRAVKGPLTPRHAPQRAASKDPFKFSLDGGAPVDRPKLVDDVLNQQLCRLVDCGSRQPHERVATVWALPVREHTEGSDHLLQRVGLRLPSRVDALV